MAGIADKMVLDHRTKYMFGHSSGSHVIVAYLTVRPQKI
jgi:hypothetical protein